MSQKLTSMLIVRTMLQLLQRSSSERSIATELKISRNTLRKYDAAFKASPYSYQQLLAMDDTTLSEVIYPTIQDELFCVLKTPNTRDSGSS